MIFYISPKNDVVQFQDVFIQINLENQLGKINLFYISPEIDASSTNCMKITSILKGFVKFTYLIKNLFQSNTIHRRNMYV